MRCTLNWKSRVQVHAAPEVSCFNFVFATFLKYSDCSVKLTIVYYRVMQYAYTFAGTHCTGFHISSVYISHRREHARV